MNGTKEYSCYENGKLKAEADSTGTVTAVNHYGLVLFARDTLTESYYYLYNAHRDVVMLVYTQGGIAATYQYDAFGNIIKATGTADNTTTYAGYQYDESTGLYYVNARYYDSTTARFLTEDSYTGEKNDPLSLNRYTYCANNPLKYYDPSGHIAVSVTDELIEENAGKQSIVSEGVTSKSSDFNLQLSNDLFNNFVSAAASSNTLMKQVQYSDEIFKLLNNGTSSGVPTLFKYGTRFGVPISVATNIVSGVKDDRITMQYANLSSLWFAANSYTCFTSSISNSLKSYAYNRASEKEKKLMDWATSTRAYSDTVTIPPWMMKEAMGQMPEKLDVMADYLYKNSRQVYNEINKLPLDPEYFYLPN